MYRANYISKGLSWRMLMDGRLSKGCTAHGKAWKVLEGTGVFWTHGLCLDIDGWLSDCMPHVSCIHLIVVSLPFVYTWFYSSYLCYAFLLTLRLLIAYWAWLIVCYCTLVGVLISCSRVTGSSPAWLLVFYCRSTRAYSRAPILSSSVAIHLSLVWTLFYLTCATIQLVVCLIVHIINLCD